MSAVTQMVMLGVKSGYTPTGVEVTPTMTSNTAPSPFVVSGTAPGFGTLYTAFNKVNGDQELLWNPPGSAVTLQMQLDTSYYLASYSVQSRNSATAEAYNLQSPKDWTFQGSNDGSAWTTLDTQTGITGWTQAQTRTFTITNPAQWSYFKLVFTANGGSVNWLAVNEVRVYS